MAGEPVIAAADQLPTWVTLVRAPNPGPLTLEGTNSWVLRAAGDPGCLIVDPGPRDEAHLRTLAGYGPVAGILVTHGHPDHVEGVDRLVELTGAPLVEAAPGVDRIVTPGHTADSVCYFVDLDGQRAVLTGDTILGRGTAVVAHPDGNLGDYLRSLALLTRYAGVSMLPGHGPALADCAAAAEYYLEHRRVRLDQVRAALATGAATPRQVVEIVYADVDPSLWPWAEWSVRAQLAYLAEPAPADVPGPQADVTGPQADVTGPQGDPESPPAGVRWDTS